MRLQAKMPQELGEEHRPLMGAQPKMPQQFGGGKKGSKVSSNIGPFLTVHPQSKGWAKLDAPPTIDATPRRAKVGTLIQSWPIAKSSKGEADLHYAPPRTDTKAAKGPKSHLEYWSMAHCSSAVERGGRN
jgi:hypothetical protein